MRRQGLFICALALAASPAFAQEDPDRDVDAPTFMAVDRDGNGYISRAEAVDTNASAAVDQFQQADADGDGRLDEQEYDLAVELDQVTTPTSPYPAEEFVGESEEGEWPTGSGAAGAGATTQGGFEDDTASGAPEAAGPETPAEEEIDQAQKDLREAEQALESERNAL